MKMARRPLGRVSLRELREERSALVSDAGEGDMFEDCVSFGDEDDEGKN